MDKKQLDILCTLDNVLDDLEQNIELTKYLQKVVTDLHIFAQINLAMNGSGSMETAVATLLNSSYWKKIFEEQS